MNAGVARFHCSRFIVFYFISSLLSFSSIVIRQTALRTATSEYIEVQPDSVIDTLKLQILLLYYGTDGKYFYTKLSGCVGRRYYKLQCGSFLQIYPSKFQHPCSAQDLRGSLKYNKQPKIKNVIHLFHLHDSIVKTQGFLLRNLFPKLFRMYVCREN